MLCERVRVELGFRLAGTAARSERRRLTKSLSQAPATMQKRERDYLPQWKQEQIWVDSSEACVCDPGWQSIIWNTVYLELQVLFIQTAQTAAASRALPLEPKANGQVQNYLHDVKRIWIFNYWKKNIALESIWQTTNSNEVKTEMTKLEG